MIIWLASYPRSGNTLLRIILKSVFERQTFSKYDDPNDIGSDAAVRSEVGHEFLGEPWTSAYGRMREDDALHLVKTHDPPEDDGRAIYVVRDGRAACRSFFHYLKDFPRLDDTFGISDVVCGFTPFGSWGDHLDAWLPAERPSTLLLSYEDLVGDPETQIQKIADFTGLRPLHGWRNNFDKLHALNPSFFRAGANNNAATALSDMALDLFWVQHHDWMGRLGYPGAPDSMPADMAVRLRQFLSPKGRRYYYFGERLLEAETSRDQEELARQIARVEELERESAVTASRLQESHALAVTQTERAAAREADWLSKFAARSAEIDVVGGQVVELRSQLEVTRSQLVRLNAGEEARRELVASLTTQLEQERDRLHATIGDLEGHRRYAVGLAEKLQEAESKLHAAAVALSERREKESTLSSRLGEAHRRLDAALAAPGNRRPWPSGLQGAPRLPATMPGGTPWPRISVVTPSFNQGQYIEQTILSVLGQNYPNLEYILIDGGSTDQTMRVVNRYAERIDVVVSEKDAGQSNAINKGFARATGELFTWINSDDMLESGALAALAMAFHTSGADMVAGVCTRHVDGVVENRHLTSCASGVLPVDDLLDLDDCWLRGQFFYQPEVMFTRDLWLRAGGRLDESLHYSMDYDLWLRFAGQQAKLQVIGRPIALYRVHEQQKTYRMESYRPELERVRDAFARSTGRAVRSSGRTDDGPVKSQLRVVFFNDLGDAGGAAIAHQRLAASVAQAGHVAIPMAIRRSLVRCQLPNESIVQAIADQRPDIVFIGNIHSAGLDPALIGLISERWPTLQVLHDLYSLTGRCAYTGGCEKYVTGCDSSCPTPGEYPALESSRIAEAWSVKNAVMTGGHAPVLAAVSRWTADFARHRFTEPSGGNGAGVVSLPRRSPPVLEIRYGLSVDIFKPRDRSTCREIHGLPQDRFIVLFSSSALADKRKGLDHLIAALNGLKLPDLLAVCVGRIDADLSGAGFESRCMGYKDDDMSLAMLYSAADLFVGPSLVETFGQVFIEAAACGIPSVGYATAGGVADAIADGISGHLAADEDPAKLAALIARLHGDPNLRRDMGVWGRLWIENEFSFRSSFQRVFAGMKQIGLTDRLQTPPNVSFSNHAPAMPGPVIYLDPLPPEPTTAELLAIAERRIAGLYSEIEAMASKIECDIRQLRGELETVRSESHDRAVEIDSLKDQMNARTRELEAQRDSAIAERDARDLLIRNMTGTRLWRMASAVYPIYQRALGRRPAASRRKG
jgi:glycosyltransferase involved in cell wall biosynthesis